MKFESKQLNSIDDWGLALKKRRQFLGMSQDQLAQILNVSRPTVDKWEKGLGDMTIRAVDWILANKWIVCPRCDGRGFCKEDQPDLSEQEEHGRTTLG